MESSSCRHALRGEGDDGVAHASMLRSQRAAMMAMGQFRFRCRAPVFPPPPSHLSTHTLTSTQVTHAQSVPLLVRYFCARRAADFSSQFLKQKTVASTRLGSLAPSLLRHASVMQIANDVRWAAFLPVFGHGARAAEFHIFTR